MSAAQPLPANRKSNTGEGKWGLPPLTKRDSIESDDSCFAGGGRSHFPSPVLPRFSKNEFQRQLDDAIVTGRQSVVSADVIGDLAKVWRSERNITASLACIGSDTRSERIH